MSLPFGQTTRSLSADSGRVYLVLLVAGLMLLVGWGGWFVFGQVTVYETSQWARLEVDASVHSVEVHVAGRVLESRLRLDGEVETGEVLVRLDARSLELEFEERQGRIEILKEQLGAIDEAVAAQTRSIAGSDAVTRAGQAEARARYQKAKIGAEYALKHVEHLGPLHATGYVTTADYERAVAQAEELNAGAAELEQAQTRLQREGRLHADDRRIDVAHLGREKVSIHREIHAEEGAMRRLEHLIAEHIIEAPIAGRIGRLEELRPGMVVQVGQSVASIVPEGKVGIVAQFPPHDALGRIHPGHYARLRLDGFPWTQYGVIEARVVRVASEPGGGYVRVELGIEKAPPQLLQHGLPGAVEIAVEEVSPAILVLRAAGKLTTPRTSVLTRAGSDP